MSLNYRLNILGWYNFEVLVQTLLKRIIGPGVTSFGGTKDEGRDAYFRGRADYPSKRTKWKGKWIFQVKYSELEQLTDSKENTRLLKEFRLEIKNIVSRHKSWPDNFILITNIRLTAAMRRKLEEEIIKAGFPGNFHTIDGKEVCEFLTLYSNIRMAFPQLIGLADIEKIINKDLYLRSEAFVTDWQPKLATFVAVQPYFKALEIIRNNNFVVLDGPPEVGKSFIGAAITLAYTCEGYEIMYVQSPSEIFKIYDASKEQLFFADDVIGSIQFNAELGNDWAHDISAVLRKLDKSHKLIWTVRKYILEEAMAITKLKENIDKFPGIHEVVVEVSDFTEMEKGLILYNHVKHSDLSKEARDFIKIYAIWICHHECYTPERIRELVQFILPGIKGKITSEEQASWMVIINDFLKEPKDRFKRAYLSLGQSEQELLLALLNFGTMIEINELKKEYEKRISSI